MKKLFLILAIMLISLPTYATNWVEVKDKVYVDTDSIEPFVNDYGRIEPDKFIFWTKKMNDNSNTFMSLENYYKRLIGHFVDKEVIDFQLKRIAIKANNIYDTDSKLMNKFDIVNYRMDWHYITPDTNDQAIYDEVLKFKIKYDKEQEELAKKRQEEEEAKKQAELEKLEQQTIKTSPKRKQQ